MVETIEIGGHQIDLPEDRHVWVGKGVWPPDIDGAASIFVEFRTGEKRTRLRLSQEAASALRYLLGQSEPPSEAVKRFIGFMTSVEDSKRGHYEWVLVAKDELPSEAPSQAQDHQRSG